MAAPHRVFVLKLVAKRGSDPIRALRWLLKLALRKFGFRCTSIEEIIECEVPDA